MAKKQIKDLNVATDLNDNCWFIIDDSNDKTKKVSFSNLIQKIIAKIDVRIGMPDYKATPTDVRAAIDASTDKEWVATENGWLNIQALFPSVTSVFIDGVLVANSSHNSDHWTYNEANTVPISNGDKVTYNSSNPSAVKINFYPCKTVP